MNNITEVMPVKVSMALYSTVITKINVWFICDSGFDKIQDLICSSYV